MATQTPNLGLTKSDLNENADISVINANMDIIDAKYKEVDDKASNITVPVTSVNAKTGAVVLSASDVNASDGQSVETHLADITNNQLPQKASQSDLDTIKYRMYMGV